MELDIVKTLTILNQKLKKAGVHHGLYICGGAALFLLGMKGRATGDLDILEDCLDPVLSKAVEEVAKEMQIDSAWLNTQVFPLVKDFNKDWKENSTEVFKESNLSVFAIERQLLINTKLRAAVNRKAFDSEDLLWLKPNAVELQKAKDYVLSTGFEGPEAVIDAEIQFILDETK